MSGAAFCGVVVRCGVVRCGVVCGVVRRGGRIVGAVDGIRWREMVGFGGELAVGNVPPSPPRRRRHVSLYLPILSLSLSLSLNRHLYARA